MTEFTDSPTKRAVLDLMKREGNDMCADCGRKDPDWADVSYGVFICIECSGIHRSLGAHLCKVKSIRLDQWVDDHVQAMENGGNYKARERLEANIPPCWKPPAPTDSIVCREQWIRAKYERQEFLLEKTDAERSYTTGTKKGFLYKKKKVDNVWQSRFFVLDSDSVRYYRKLSDPQPTESIPLLELNVTMNGLTGQPHGMQLTALLKGRTRNIFVYAESGQDIMNWFCAIRAARLSLLQAHYPEKPLTELYDLMSRDFVKAGYLHKTPPNKPRFQKRYFVLDQRRLMYFEKPTDAFPLGEIVLSTSAEGFTVDESAPSDLLGGENAFVLNTPMRTYPLLAETSDDKHAWIAVMRAAIDFASSGDAYRSGASCSNGTYNTSE